MVEQDQLSTNDDVVEQNGMQHLITYHSVLAAYEALIKKSSSFLNLQWLKEYAESINNEISRAELVIDVQNIYSDSLPTITPVEPPTLFEAFCENMADAIDSTVGTLVDITSRGLSTVLTGVGTAVGKVFSIGGLLPIIGCIAIALVGYKLVLTNNNNNNNDDK